jgi:hypothetical protein
VESETSEGLDVVPEVFPGRSRREVRLAPVVPPAPASPRTLELVENIGVESEANAVTEIETETEIEVEVGIDIETQPEHSDAPMRAKVSPLRRHGEDGLCAHFPEFSRLEFRCPIAKSVELAVDSQGRLRLLCRDQELANAQMTQAWAQANEQLIRAAVSALGGGTLQVMIDLITDSAERVADLHRTGVRLYLLTPLDIQGEDRWFRVDLNSDETAQVPG